MLDECRRLQSHTARGVRTFLGLGFKGANNNGVTVSTCHLLCKDGTQAFYNDAVHIQLRVTGTCTATNNGRTMVRGMRLAATPVPRTSFSKVTKPPTEHLALN